MAYPISDRLSTHNLLGWLAFHRMHPNPSVSHPSNHFETFSKRIRERKEVCKMKYITKARSDEHGIAKIPLHDKNGKILNRVEKVSNKSILFYASDDIKTDYSDLSGTTAIMECRIPTEQGENVTNDKVEILRVQGNNVIVKINDVAFSVYIGIVKFIKDGE